MQTSITTELHSRARSEQRICRHCVPRPVVAIFHCKQINCRCGGQRELHRSAHPGPVSCYHKEGQCSVDLSQLNRDLQRQWHWEKNLKFGSSVVNPYSFRTATWKCPDCQHEWQTKVLDRAVSATECPQCSDNKQLSLMCSDAHYAFVSQWNHLRNEQDDIFPGDIKAGSLQPVWWQCRKCPQNWPHEWRATPFSRFSDSFECCPFCSDIKPCICNDAPRL